MTNALPLATHPRPDDLGPGPNLGRVARAELVKLRSLRAHVVLVACTTLFLVAFGPIQGLGEVLGEGGSERPASVGEVLSLALSGGANAAILVGVLGVLTVTSEYPNGLIRTTLWAVPRRGLVVSAKAAAAVAIVLPTTLIGSLIALEATRRILTRSEDPLPPIAWSDPSVWWVAVAMTAYAIGWALVGQALGWLLRSAVGASFALLGLMFVLPVLVVLLPGGVGTTLSPYLVSEAGSAMLRVDGSGAGLDPAAASGVWSAWVVAMLVLAARSLRHRDA